MNPVRRATPDSEAVVSSEDERPWPSARSFGSLPRKENGMPGIGGGIWSTQKRDSFKMEKAAQRNAARDARLGAPNPAHSGFRPGTTPSPAASDGSGPLPFAIPLQPTPKTGRSLSHSQGQQEIASRPHTGKDHAPVLPLGLLREEELDAETDSDLGEPLTHTTSHPPIGTLQRTATLPTTYSSFYGVGNGREPADSPAERGDRRFEAAFANLGLDPPQRRAQWQTHLGWDVPPVNESRRHSLADIPTRRGSLVGDHHRDPGLYNDVYEWEGVGERLHQDNARQGRDFSGPGNAERLKVAGQYYTTADMKATDLDEHGDSLLKVPEMYRVPFVRLADNERSDQDKRAQLIQQQATPLGPGHTRPRKQLYVVSFKCSRVDIFYLLDNTGLQVEVGDIVIVEADRGQDLGTVQHANVTQDEARIYKKRYGEEQYKWLMMYSKNNNPNATNPNSQAEAFGENSARSQLLANAPATMQGQMRDNFPNLKPKAIKRLANTHEIRMLGDKEGNEAKAKRACQQKVNHLHLDMEILDAEWQWDFQKLIFYYYADHYINFKDLVTELYRIYKTRIWLSAINPASFSQHALGQPPSGIGPGAITGYNQNLNNTYTMMYGQDPDPYGAIPPYRVGYETYTPNYPGIPGVANSFPPPIAANTSPQAYGNGSNTGTPTLPPGMASSGRPSDYSFYYDRSGESNEPRFAAPKPAAPASAQFANPNMRSGNDFYSSMYGATPTETTMPPMSYERSMYNYQAPYNNWPAGSAPGAGGGMGPIGVPSTSPSIASSAGGVALPRVGSGLMSGTGRPTPAQMQTQSFGPSPQTAGGATLSPTAEGHREEGFKSFFNQSEQQKLSIAGNNGLPGRFNPGLRSPTEQTTFAPPNLRGLAAHAPRMPLAAGESAAMHDRTRNLTAKGDEVRATEKR